MSIAFGLCILGLLGGMAYNLFALAAHHRTIEQALGNSIGFYKVLGGFGILGFVLFLLFLIVSISSRPRSTK